MKLGWITAAAVAIAAMTGVAQAQDTMPANISAAVADPGRPAKDTARDAERKPAAMMAFAGVKAGDKVVDLIPGSGYFTRIFAKVVGPSGHVYAFEPSEFDAEMAKSKNPSPMVAITAADPNVSVVHAPIDAFAVPEPVDIVWTSQNYHDLHDPFMGPANMAQVNAAIFKALKPGGVFIVLDHAAAAGSGTRDTNTLHRIDEATVKSEVEAAGFKLVGESNVLRNPADDHTKKVFDKSIRGHTDQFILKFQKPAS